MIIQVHKKPLELKDGVSIPSALIKEIDVFIERNYLVKINGKLDRSGGKRIKFKCCPRCLKAFALIKANEMNLGRETIELLGLWFDCETGHDGYYLDGEGLKDGRVSLHRDA